MDQPPNIPFYLSVLKEEFLRRKRRSRRYSLRAFARDLELHPSTLSRVFNGQRPIPRHALQRLASSSSAKRRNEDSLRATRQRFSPSGQLHS